MGKSAPLQDISVKNTVENVFIYICDSFRYDALPNDMKDLGVFAKAISGSTFTASGYPTIMTGQYPATHKVWTFDGVLSEPPQLLQRHNAGIDTDRVWWNLDEDANKPPLRICHETSSTNLEDLETPFVNVVHDAGGHMVYGTREQKDLWDEPRDQFADLRSDEGKLRSLYERGIRESLDRFQGFIDELKHRGIYDETLIILTSDHGELLGEYGGIYGHSSPMVPELVEVPIVFAGAGISSKGKIDGTITTADIAPTSFAALGESTPDDVDGRNLWLQQTSPDRTVRSEAWVQYGYPYIEYRAAGIWNQVGGRVRSRNNVLVRLAHAVGRNFVVAPHSPVVRKRREFRSMLHHSARGSIVYGDCGNLEIEVDPNEFSEAEERTPVVSQGPNEEQLRELGYLE